jgi:HEPN domain-containing protein
MIRGFYCMKPHEEWLYKAHNDLRAAEELVKIKPPILDVTVYHAQQCGEKALKAYMAYKNKQVERVHDIRALLERLIIIEPRFVAIREDALTITPYATLYRYPGALLQPDQTEAEEAVESAKRILHFIEELIG